MSTYSELMCKPKRNEIWNDRDNEGEEEESECDEELEKSGDSSGSLM